MDRRSLDLITALVVMFGVALAGGGWALCGQHVGVGAVLGAMLAVGNWLALRWAATRAMGESANGRELAVLLFAKMFALFGVLFVLVFALHVSALGIAIGMGALLGGLVAGGLAAGSATAAKETS